MDCDQSRSYRSFIFYFRRTVMLQAGLLYAGVALLSSFIVILIPSDQHNPME